MSPTTTEHPAVAQNITARILDEGYGPGAWHGADLKAALTDVTAGGAFWRPAAGRHNIAEIAMHHAYCVRSVRAKLSGEPAEPFALEGDDWFDLPDGNVLAWPRIQAIVEEQQRRLAALAGDIDSNRLHSSLSAAERFNLVLGITCHAVYHAGQIQLLKKLQPIGQL